MVFGNSDLDKSVFAGFCFAVLFTAHLSIQNYISLIYSQLNLNDLGQQCLFIYFAFISFGSIFALHLKNKIPLRVGLIFGALCYINFIFAGTWTANCSKDNSTENSCSPSFISLFNLFSSATLGIGASILWIFQAMYIESCAQRTSQPVLNHALFWACWSLAQVGSSLLATFRLGRTDPSTYFLICLTIGIIAVILMLFIRPPEPENNEVLLEREPQVDETLVNTLRDIYQLIVERKHLIFYTDIFFSGLAMGCYINSLANITASFATDENEIDGSIGVIFIAVSVGALLSGTQASGRPNVAIETLPFFRQLMIGSEIALVLAIIGCALKWYILILISGFFWGLTDNQSQALAHNVIVSVFNRRAGLFSAFRFFHGLGLMWSTLLSIIVGRDHLLIYLLVMAMIFAGFHFILNFAMRKRISDDHEMYYLYYYHYDHGYDSY